MAMSDKRLAEKGLEYKAHRIAADDLAKDILAELNRRGIEAGQEVESVRKHGVSIRKKARTIRHYSIDKLKQLLPRKHRPTVIIETVRLPVLDDLVKRGELSFDDVKTCLDSTEQSEPYIDVRLLQR